MAKFHFVEDYERYVKFLMKKYPIDEAMDIAVGGSFDEIGAIELAALRYAGLKNGDQIVDLGCGSGRLAIKLSKELHVSYVGFDVVKPLLDYARSKCPKEYQFAINHDLKIPLPDCSVDMFAAFSLFTHLLHTESYIYLEEMKRCLKNDGKIVFSFIEFASGPHWHIFETTVAQQKMQQMPILNQFMERNQIDVWAKHLGLKIEKFIDGDASPWGGDKHLGQSIVLLSK